MMCLGWALAFFMMSWLYHMVISQRNAHEVQRGPVSVMAMKGRSLVLQQNMDGQFVSRGSINDVPVTLLVDTGAGQVALPEELAARLGLRKMYPGEVKTAGGNSYAWATDIEKLKIGALVFRNIRAVILPDMEEQVVLLGMNALERLHFTQRAGEMVLSAPAPGGEDT